MVKVETEAPALWRKPPETAIHSTLDKRTSPRLYTLRLGARRAWPAPRPLSGCSEPIGCTVVRPDREHVEEGSEGHGVWRQSARSSLRTGAGAVAT